MLMHVASYYCMSNNIHKLLYRIDYKLYKYNIDSIDTSILYMYVATIYYIHHRKQTSHLKMNPLEKEIPIGDHYFGGLC